ncbi:MAG: phosphoribosylformylglycinamidine synthase subunit PurQ [Desulfosarcina sp.]|jgi:phosphoribosylformylglycinamidine synthase
MSTQPNVLVLTGFGLNCDHETAYAFELAGANATRAHINSLITGEVSLEDFQILAFGGGFSWGDDHGAGVIQALRMKTNVGDKLLDFVADQKLIIGICNGFQTLVNLGLLPGIDGDYTRRTVALTYNDCGNFRDQWVRVTINADSACVFTRNMRTLDMPVRHGEGKFYGEPDILDRLTDNQQITMQYALPDGLPAQGAFPYNPNGSIADIAGICDPTGRIFGLMPHPEAYNHITNHPDWTRLKEQGRPNGFDSEGRLGDGIRVFENAVTYFNS